MFNVKLSYTFRSLVHYNHGGEDATRAVNENYILIHKQRERETERQVQKERYRRQRLAWACETSKPCPVIYSSNNAMLTPTRPHLLILISFSKCFTTWCQKIQMYELMRAILIQLTQTLGIMPTAGSFILKLGEPPSSAQAAFDISWLSLLD